MIFRVPNILCTIAQAVLELLIPFPAEEAFLNRWTGGISNIHGRGWSTDAKRQRRPPHSPTTGNEGDGVWDGGPEWWGPGLPVSGWGSLF